MKAIVLIGGVLLLAGCVTPAGQGEPIEFSTVDRGMYSGVAQAACRIIETNEQFAQLWFNIYRTQRPEPPLPDIDFEHEMLAAAFQGRQPTGGYAIEIEAVERIGERTVIHVTQTAPEPGDMVTMALTSPYHVVRFARQEGGALFRGAPAGCR